MGITIAGGTSSASPPDPVLASEPAPTVQAAPQSASQPAEQVVDSAAERPEQENGSVGPVATEDGGSVADVATADPKPKKTGKIVGALVGAGIGALIGRRGNAAQGAAIGAIAGLLAGHIFDEYTVKQTKSAELVNAEYMNANGGALPTTTTVTRYATRVEPQAVVARGGEIQFVSDIEIVRGTEAASQSDVIEQEIILFDPSGQGEKRVRKPAVESATESGAYSTQFLFKPSKSTAQGQYPFKTILYLNGEQVQEQSGTIQIAALESWVGKERVV